MSTRLAKIVLSSGALVALTALAGCDANRVIAIDRSVVQVGAGADLHDPYGGCQATDSSIPAFPFRCSQGPGPCTGGTEGSLCNAGVCGPMVFHIMCEHLCEIDADCPIPSTGASRPVCLTDLHVCQLPCDDTTTCPTGYTCQETANWLSRRSNNEPFFLPRLCMETITITTSSDGGPPG